MKKDIRKKFYLVAMVASLALLWGGVTSCSNGSDDDGTTVRLKGNFFEELGDDEADKKADWVYCEDKLIEKENGIWEGEITAVRGWDDFGIEVNGTWYGAKDGLEGSVTDAELVKDSEKNFWLATNKDGKSKVIVNLNKMTITVEAVNNSSNDNTGNDGNTSGGNNDNDDTTTLPTAVILQGYIDGNKDNWNNELATMDKTDDGKTWTTKLTSQDQWPHFGVKAIVNEKDLYYSKGGEVKLGSPLVMTTEGDDIWCNVEAENAKILVTVDFTKADAPTIKIEIATE